MTNAALSNPLKDKPHNGQAFPLKDKPHNGQAFPLKDKPHNGQAFPLKDIPHNGQAFPLKDRPHNGQAFTLKNKSHNGQAFPLKDRPHNGQAFPLKDKPHNGQAFPLKDIPHNGQAFPLKDRPHNGQAFPLKDKPHNGQAFPLKDRPHNGQAFPLKDRPYNGQAFPLKDRPHNGQVFPLNDIPYNGQGFPLENRPYNGQAFPLKNRPHNGQALPIKDRPHNGQDFTLKDRPYNGQAFPLKDRPYNGQAFPLKDRRHNGQAFPLKDRPHNGQAFPLKDRPHNGQAFPLKDRVFLMERAIAISFLFLTFVYQSSGQCEMLMCRINPFIGSQSRLTTSDIDLNLCSYIIIAIGLVTNEENVIYVKPQVRQMYSWMSQAKRKNPKLKFVMAFYIETFYEMYLDPAKRSELFQACIRHLRDNRFVGMTIELNYGFGYDVYPHTTYTKHRFADFLQDAQNAFTDEAKGNDKPKLLLFGTLPGFTNIILKDYDVPRTFNYSDFVIFNILSYGEDDYWTGWETIDELSRRHHSRIYKLDPEDTFNLDYYSQWIISVGGIKSKTIVSVEVQAIFYYNRRAPGLEPNYKLVRILNYGEMCDFLRKGGQIARASNISPFHIYDRMLTFYDDEFSVKER
ncbi:chitotriosidase-1, partial [Biomphalaria glabrata]